MRDGKEMKRTLTADSGGSLFELVGTDFTAVPMVITLDEKHITDAKNLDIPDFIAHMYAADTSSTACPSAGLWEESFKDADEAFAVTISSGLSGSYNAAMMGKDLYEEAHPDRKVLIVDSLSAGPEQRLITEKLAELMKSDMSFEEIEKTIKQYRKHTHILFSLQSFTNFAKNGRINPVIAKTAQMLGIRVIATGNDQGKIDIDRTVHGAKRMLSVMFDEMKKTGFNGKRVIIGHCQNPDGANAIKDKILNEFPFCNIIVQTLDGLCSYYAEKGGLLVGFEDSEA